MPHTLRSLTIATALLAGTGLAFAGGDKASGSSSSTEMKSGTTGQSSSTQMQSGTTGQASTPMSKSGAEAKLNLTSSQKQTISKELADETAANASFSASLGAKVPDSIALKPVPMTVANEIPSIKSYSYAKLQDDNIVLVDPKDRTVAAVIEDDASTTGSSSTTSGSGSSSMSKDKK
jgi:hypothetical protein